MHATMCHKAKMIDILLISWNTKACFSFVSLTFIGQNLLKDRTIHTVFVFSTKLNNEICGESNVFQKNLPAK
jgi:hypothetical protein